MGGPDISEWRRQRLPYLRGLAKPSYPQQRLLRLTAYTDRSPTEERELEQLWKAERINERAEVERQAAYRLVKDKAAEKRRSKNQRLLDLGGLVQRAGLDLDDAELLGGLLALADRLKQPDRTELLARYKAGGDKVFAADRQATVRPSRNPPPTLPKSDSKKRVE